MCNLLLSSCLLLLCCSLLKGHPAADSAQMSYPGPDSVEETDELSVTGLSDLLQRAAASAGQAPLLNQRESLKMLGQIPKEAVKEFLLDKPYSNSGAWPSRRQFRKRAGAGADCFWKYCV